MNPVEIKNALQELYLRLGTQSAMADLAGITQSTINAYINGRAKIENMPLGIFLKLFRDVRIDFFGNQKESRVGSIYVGGTVGGRVQQNINGKMTIRENGDPPQINYDLLGRNLRKDERFSAEEKLKFLDFLDEQK